MRKKIVIVDLLAEHGHIVFIKETIKILSLKYEVLFISSSSYINKVGFDNSYGINDNLFCFKNKYDFVNSQRKVIKELKSIPFINSSIILVTSFENISFSLFWKMNNKTFMFLHNNLDKGFISSFFLKKIKPKYSFLVFEKYLKNHLNNIKNRCHYIPHPLDSELKTIVTSFNDYVFAPNIKLNSSNFKNVLNFIDETGFKLLVKGKVNNLNNERILIKPYFEDYKELIANAAYIILEITYDYRVSNIFYECMALNKKIILLDNYGEFGKKMKDLYPQNIFIGDLSKVKFSEPSNALFLQEHSIEKITERYGKIFK